MATKNSFTFDLDWIEQIRIIEEHGTPDDRQYFWNAVYTLASGIPMAVPENAVMGQLALIPMRDQIEKEHMTSVSRQQNGAKGGKPKQTKANESKSEANVSKAKQNEANGGKEERERETESEKESSKEKDKDKEIEREEYTDASFSNTNVLSNSLSCSEPEKPASEPPEPPVITLTLNDGSEWPVTTEMVTEWSSLYPAVDVMQQLRNMRGWLLSNPNKRKTGRGIKAFINTWLTKEQDRPRARSGTIDNRPHKLTAEELFNLPAISLRKENDW